MRDVETRRIGGNVSIIASCVTNLSRVIELRTPTRDDAKPRWLLLGRAEYARHRCALRVWLELGKLQTRYWAGWDVAVVLRESMVIKLN